MPNEAYLRLRFEKPAPAIDVVGGCDFARGYLAWLRTARSSHLLRFTRLCSPPPPTIIQRYTLHLPREYDAKFPTVPRVELRGPQSSIISASIHLPLSTTYSTTMPPRWKSDARRRPPRFAYIPSCLPLLLLLILFSFLLSSVALLSHFRSPAAKQQLGWQAWDVVEMHYAKPDDEDTAVFAPSIPLEYWVS